MMKDPFHPGEILSEEFLKPAGTRQTAFAAKLGWTRTRLNVFINGTCGVTADSALDLAAATDATAKFWMNLQATWDLAQPQRKRKAA